jgi:hypothetical protein
MGLAAEMPRKFVEVCFGPICHFTISDPHLAKHVELSGRANLAQHSAK